MTRVCDWCDKPAPKGDYFPLTEDDETELDFLCEECLIDAWNALNDTNIMYDFWESEND